MVDVVDKETRSRMMSGIRGKDTKPEMQVRRFLHAAGFRFRLHVKGLPGRPDIVLPKYRTVIQVHGCFWHRHSGCRYATAPASNAEVWAEKFARNVERDRDVERQLKELGWRVITVWECEVKSAKFRVVVMQLRSSHFPEQCPISAVCRVSCAAYSSTESEGV